jgi:predicted site-specific integrase-resolvase
MENVSKQSFVMNVISPVMSPESYASFLGITIGTVKGWISQGTVPSVKIGRQRFVNVNQVVSDLEEGKTIFTRGDYQD